LAGLNAYYGDNHAVKGIDLEFAPNEVTAIIGPSGCGKSTMVRCINRMHEEIPGARATGSVRLDEQDVYAPSVDVVSVRRTVAVEPEVILMDEPCSALDPIATLRIEELIEELKQRYTIVVVTHNMQQAARVADRTAFMLAGELVEVDSTEKIFTTPSDSRT